MAWIRQEASVVGHDLVPFDRCALQIGEVGFAAFTGRLALTVAEAVGDVSSGWAMTLSRRV